GQAGLEPAALVVGGGIQFTQQFGERWRGAWAVELFVLPPDTAGRQLFGAHELRGPPRIRGGPLHRVRLVAADRGTVLVHDDVDVPPAAWATSTVHGEVTRARLRHAGHGSQ